MTYPDYRLLPAAVTGYQVRRFVYLKKDHLRRARQVANDLHDDLRLRYGVLEAVDADDARRHLGDGFYVQEVFLNLEKAATLPVGRWAYVEDLLHRGWPGSQGGTPCPSRKQSRLSKECVRCSRPGRRGF